MKRKLAIAAAVLAVPALVDLVVWLADVDLGIAGWLLRFYSLAVVAGLLAWGLAFVLRRLLWRVSRRLAFSYFLIGVVPIPLALLVLAAGAYLVTGFLLGHLYRDAAHSLAADLRQAVRAQLGQLSAGGVPRASAGLPVLFGYYQNGRKLAGAPGLPETWQDWWVSETLDASSPSPMSLPYVAREDGRPTLMAAAQSEGYGILGVFAGDLELELSERSGVWVELLRSDELRVPEDGGERVLKITIDNREYPLRMPTFGGTREQLAEFFHPGIENPGFVDRPSLFWVESSQPFYVLDGGTLASDFVSVRLAGSGRTILFHLFSRSAEVDVLIYLVCIAVAFLLFDLYLVAAAMAAAMSYGLSRAVDQLTVATEKVGQGEFADAAIDVRRRDQVGALQLSFNRMAGTLEETVAAAAQKEALEHELQIARELQESLLPALPGDGAELGFATFFEPSAAIGGDYYDVRPTAGGHTAVFTADVSGHGLSAGLRMAMVKAALWILCEQENEPAEILRRLHNMIKEEENSGFVTATLAVVDVERGEVTITNAGHPPTYLLRDGEVREILLPGVPLGVLDGRFGRTTLQLEPGDLLVWLSDGLIEATDDDDEPFGFDRVMTALRGLPPAPDAVREALLAAVREHAGTGPAEDDLTVVVMAYRPASYRGAELSGGDALSRQLVSVDESGLNQQR